MNYTRKYAIVGAAFGAAFPIAGSVLDAAFRVGSASWSGVLRAQATSPLLWIIDTAPIWLGLFAALAGRKQDDLAAVNVDLVRSAEVRNRYVASSLEELFVELERATVSLMHVTKTENDRVQRQASGLSQASSMTQEIKETATLASQKAAAVIEIAARAESASLAGQTAVEASLAGIHDIRGQVDAIVEKIADLAERTLQIGDIIESVKDLADQSNVLALNAAIEASKAGEFGKGFVVVSREIRTLSDQSIRSTGRIREILSQIQAAIRATATITDAGRRRMEQSMEQIRVSGESLTEVMTTIRDSTVAARQIAASVTQQGAGISQISAAIRDLREAMEETVVGIHDSERDAQKLKQISDKISEIGRTVSRVA